MANWRMYQFEKIFLEHNQRVRQFVRFLCAKNWTPALINFSRVWCRRQGRSRFESSSDRFVSIVRFLRVPNEQLPSRSSVLVFSSFRPSLFFPSFVLQFVSVFRHSLSDLYGTSLRQCRLKSTSTTARSKGERDLNFVFTARAIKISSDVGGIELGSIVTFKLRWSLDLEASLF